MILYRLTEDHKGQAEGSCIPEFRYKGLHYLDKPLWEVIEEHEVEEMIKYDEEKYCLMHNIEYLLFYNDAELNRFLNKEYESNINN